MKRVLPFVVAVACGSPAPTVVQLPATASASAAPATHVATANACAVWTECRRVVEPVRVSEASIGQSPDVAWDGSEAIVVYETLREGSHVVAVGNDGRILWNELVAGTSPQIAWNARARSGLVITSETIAWLGRDGRPAHRTNVPRVVNVTFHGAVAPMGDGFLVVSGVGAHASNAQPFPFSIAKVGAPADAIDWRRVDDDGLRYAPVIAPDATWIASQPFKSAAQLFAISNASAIGPPLALPNAPSARAVAIGEERAMPVVVFVDDATHELAVTVAKDGAVSGPSAIGVRSTRSGSAVVLHVGGRLVVGADKIGDSPGVALAPFDPTGLHVGAPLAIGPESSQHLRAVATDHGFVATWNIADDAAPTIPLSNGGSMHGLSAMLAIYACCPAP